MKRVKKIFNKITNPQNISMYLNKSLKKIGLNRRDNYQRFIILSRSRTGSNLLISYLNSHPNILAENEIFQRLQGKDYQKILTQTFRPYPERIRAVGFKIFYYHPVDVENCLLWDDLIAMKNLHIIHLKRRNILRVLVSRKIAARSKSWSSVDAKLHEFENEKTVSFDCDELQDGFQKTRQWEIKGDEKFQGHPVLTIYWIWLKTFIIHFERLQIFWDFLIMRFRRIIKNKIQKKRPLCLRIMRNSRKISPVQNGNPFLNHPIDGLWMKNET
jgi:hypothetical protein